ncbi:MAG: riboflavin synthase [Candidatus Saccharicenans sp.]|uniref:riboflavin synthase n=1 Tax=Candidatus Saccharicenans sp. TaxID=2819258 RepID=UPI00404B2E43
MFNGIISHRGLLREYRKSRSELVIEVPEELSRRLEKGQSLAVDGVCLTVTAVDGRLLTFNLSTETLEKTTLGRLRPGQELNLELPVTANSLLGGHLVTGHVDGIGQVLEVKPRRPGRRLKIRLERELRKFVVEKGSISLNGVSLTVAALAAGYFEVELIPATLEETNLGRLRPGDWVNLECDIIGKYVYNFISRSKY